jgi:hypothetical protein
VQKNILQQEKKEKRQVIMLNFEFLKSQGLTMWFAGNKLRVAPPEKVTPEIASFIRAHKQDIMAELKSPVIYRNSYPQGTPEARQESLMQCMDVTWQEVHKSVKEAYESKQRQFKAIPHILIIEQRIEILRRDVLKGKAKLKEFTLTAYEWERAAKAELN